MKKVNVTISFEDEKLDALQFFTEKRLRYGRRPDTTGLFGTVPKPLVFSWCLNLCDAALRYYI